MSLLLYFWVPWDQSEWKHNDLPKVSIPPPHTTDGGVGVRQLLKEGIRSLLKHEHCRSGHYSSQVPAADTYVLSREH